MKNQLILFIFSLFFVGACIQDDFLDDFVEPEIRITTLTENLTLGNTFQFEAKYLNNIGIEEQVTIDWSSSDESVISIDNSGLATANGMGTAMISVETMQESQTIRDMISVTVTEDEVSNSESITGIINTTTFYTLEGDFELIQEGDDLTLNLGDNYEASSTLPGLYVYLTNNRNSINGALEIGAVSVFSGAHSYNIPDTGLRDFSFILYYCKPFNVKVGDGQIQ